MNIDPSVLLLTLLCIAVAYVIGKRDFGAPSSTSSSSSSLSEAQVRDIIEAALNNKNQDKENKKNKHSSSSSSSSESDSDSERDRRRRRRRDEEYDREYRNRSRSRNNNNSNNNDINQSSPLRAYKRDSFSFDSFPPTSASPLSGDAQERLLQSMTLSPSFAPSNSSSSSFTSSSSSSSSSLSHDLSQSNNNELGNLHVNRTMLALQQRNKLLQRQLALAEFSNVVEVDDKYRSKLTPSEIETIRAIFNIFDTNNNGAIRSEDLKALHLKLGEPLTDEEAANALSDLDIDGTGEVTFNKFVYWWYESHKGGKRSNTYTNRFKLLHAKLASDPTFNCDKVITQDSGTVYTLEYRMGFYYKSGGGGLKQISPWHDIPLYRIGSGSDKNGQLYNMIVEIPKWTRAKFEVATGEPFNPIKQDTKNGALRYYKHGDMMFNYGLFPQTWEDPAYSPSDTKCPGDNDPIDAVELGCRQLKTGSVVAVKLLGVLALIDDGETDWKCLVVCINDPLAAVLNDIDDVDTHLPGAIHAIREYFRDYKNYAGGKQNYYGLREQAMPRSYAVKVVEQTHHHWMTLHLERKQHTVTKEQLTLMGQTQEQGQGQADGKAPTDSKETTSSSSSSSSSTESNESPQR